MTKTKILATLGPASFDKIPELIKAGVDGFRFNMAHVSPDEYGHRKGLIKKIREIDDKIFISADLEGPKIRLGTFDSIDVRKDEEVEIITENKYSGKGIPIKLDDFYKYLKKDDKILIDDGKVCLRVSGINGKVVKGVVECDGIIEKRKGVNVPYVSIPIPFPSEKDKRDAEFCAEAGIDIVFASYTRNVDDLIEWDRLFGGTGILKGSKPENYEGFKNIEEIIQNSDIVMIPRGDAGMEIGVAKIPAYQKMIIERCNVLGIPVVTATQMLESMTFYNEPTRAEVSDVFNAVLDGSDVVMLSGETSKGKYPVEAVHKMDEIAEEAEKYLFDPSSGVNLGEKLDKLIKTGNSADLISKSVYAAASSKDIKAIIVPTSTSYTARMISRFRMEKPVIAVAYDERVKRQLNVMWGVFPLITDRLHEEKEIVQNAVRVAKEKGYVAKDDSVLVTTGFGDYGKGSTNIMRIEKVS